MNITKKTEGENKWYPFYTRSRFEKKAFINLEKAGFEVFLPLKKSERVWSDRKKIVDIPLFSSYIFVKIPQHKLHDVLQIYGIVRYITFNNRPAVVRDSEIELIKLLLDDKTDVEVLDGLFEAGAEVTLSSGLFKGYSGKVVTNKGKNKVVIEIESINKSLIITIDKSNIKTDNI